MLFEFESAFIGVQAEIYSDYIGYIIFGHRNDPDWRIALNKNDSNNFQELDAIYKK